MKSQASDWRLLRGDIPCAGAPLITENWPAGPFGGTATSQSMDLYCWNVWTSYEPSKLMARWPDSKGLSGMLKTLPMSLGVLTLYLFFRSTQYWCAAIDSGE